MGLALIEKNALVAEWTATRAFWPVADADGTWLLITEIERRVRPDGQFEYRSFIDGL